MTHSDQHHDRVRVLHLGKYFPPEPGGMETYLRDLMEHSLKQGVRSAALVHQSKSGIKSLEERYEVDSGNLTIVRVASWFRLLFTPISPAFPFVLNRLIQRFQPELLHLHLPNPSAFWALLLPAARRVPWVVHWQSDVLTPISSWVLRFCYVFYRPFESALLKRASTIITTSEQYLSSSRTLTPFTDRCCVIPLGLRDRFGPQEIEATSGASDGPIRVLAIGRLAHYKGFDTLLRAIAKAPNTQLDLVGSGEQSDHLQALSRSLGIEGRVRFCGAINDTERDALLRACDCLCLPSVDRTESFGIVLLEAMSAGKACVISDVPGSGMASLVEANVTGLVVPMADHDALAAALTELAQHRPLLNEMGAQGRRRFEQGFTIATSTDAVLALYRQLEPSTDRAHRGPD